MLSFRLYLHDGLTDVVDLLLSQYAQWAAFRFLYACHFNHVNKYFCSKNNMGNKQELLAFDTASFAEIMKVLDVVMNTFENLIWSWSEKSFYIQSMLF